MTRSRVPAEWYRQQYQQRLAETVAAAPPLTFEAQQLIRRLMGSESQEPAPAKPVKKVRRVCRTSDQVRAYRRYRAGA